MGRRTRARSGEAGTEVAVKPRSKLSQHKLARGRRHSFVRTVSTKRESGE